MSKQTDFFKQYQISSYKANTLTKIIKYHNFFCSFVKLIAGLFIAISYIAFYIVTSDCFIFLQETHSNKDSEKDGLTNLKDNFFSRMEKRILAV